MNQTPRISLVIPIYNAERFLGECLASLAKQTFRDFEVIAVNDGSTDGSLALLRRLEKEYGFLRVIDQENGGVSAARNNGMAAARGEYLGFVDADDYVSPRYLERLYRTCVETGAEIACCYYFYKFDAPEFLWEYPFRCHGVFNRTEAMNLLLHDTQMQGLMWNKLFLRSLFTEHNVTFPAMNCLEDMIAMHRLFPYINRLAVIDEPLYYYRKHGASALSRITPSKINDFTKAMVLVREMLEEEGRFGQYERSYRALLKKTSTCCYLYTIKMHARQLRPQGCLRNLRALRRAFRYYGSEGFAAPEDASVVSDVVYMPGKLEKDYIR